ncbi:MAG TPA: hypothetical protein VLH56_03480 [Dissulfurispiraceae bacterium]|nr:hypothetical protein [Dissulfurispiraceae bacterium]
MKTILWTSARFDGELEFRFNEDGLLVGYDDRGELAPDQRAWILAGLPRNEKDLRELAARSKSIKLVEVKKDVVFDDFWQRYDHKVVSSKKKARAAWDRLPRAEQLKAYNYIARYFQSLAAGVAKKYAETYLNSSIWNN